MAFPVAGLAVRTALRAIVNTARQEAQRAALIERGRVMARAAAAETAALQGKLRIQVKFDKGSGSGLMGLLVRGNYVEAQRKMRVAQAIALTKTAQAVQRALADEIDRAFASPTAFTKRAIGITPASQTTLQAAVFVRDAQADYLRPQIFGGARQPKRFEKRLAGAQRGVRVPGSVPGAGVRLNASGNIPRPTLVRLLQQAGTKGSGVFIPEPSSELRPGIYKRVGRKAVPLLIFSQDAPTYRKRFDFFEIVQREVDRHWPIEIERAMRRVFSD